MDHYGRPVEKGRPLYFSLWFLSFFFLLLFLFSSPNLSGRRLDVYYTSTQDGVALVQIKTAGLKCAARGSLEMQDAKIRQKFAIWAPLQNLSGCIFASKAFIDNRKSVKQQYLLHMYWQYGKLRPTSGWGRFGSLGHPCKFQRVSRPGSVTARHSSSGHQPNYAALNIGRHLYSAGRPSRWAFAHVLVW